MTSDIILKEKVVYSRIKENQLHPSFRGRPLHTCHGGWGGAAPEGLQTCFESGVRRFRLAVDMVREMLIPANWRLLLPKMLDSILLGGCEIKQCDSSFDSHGCGLSAVPVCHTPKPPPSRPHEAREGDCATNELGGGT